MTTVTADPTPEAIAGRIFDAALATFDILSIHLGDRLGLYRALADSGPATAGELAARAGIAERYAREWLEQQAATGLLSVEAEGAADAATRRFRLPAGAAEALIDSESPYSVAPLARSLVACASVMPELLSAYRTGAGVPWTSYGTDMVEAQGDFNRPWLLASLGDFLASIPDVDRRLRSDPAARVADVACGVGWASIAIARAYPNVRVDGFDLDEASIDRARIHATEAGLADRVNFHGGDAAQPGTTGAYDLAIVIEAVHDLSQPVEVLRAIRQRLAPGGTAIVVDEKTAEMFTAPADAAERLFYGYSVTCCLPTAMTEQPSAATGTVMRASTLEAYARQAGFSAIDVLDLPHDFLRFYRMTP